MELIENGGPRRDEVLVGNGKVWHLPVLLILKYAGQCLSAMIKEWLW
jgi:hypothetical protein